jgi:hypothetical protein
MVYIKLILTRLLQNIKLCTSLNVQILNFDHEMEKILVRCGPKNHSGNF